MPSKERRTLTLQTGILSNGTRGNGWCGRSCRGVRLLRGRHDRSDRHVTGRDDGPRPNREIAGYHRELEAHSCGRKYGACSPMTEIKLAPVVVTVNADVEVVSAGEGT